ncbi:trypsin-like peptidase domain-containing protein [Sorangium sp. So ce134]
MTDELLSPDAMGTLREALSWKYPTDAEARRFVADVRLDPRRITFHGRADLTWFSILEEAQKRGASSVRAVLDRAIKEYPEDEVLARLRDGAAVRYAEGPSIAALPWRGSGGPTLEKILGTQSSLVPVSYLEVGIRRAQAVARIQVSDGSLGTGFLMAGDLLVTNHHVLGDRDAAADASAQFNYQKTVEGRDAEPEELCFDPDAFFVTSSDDDCTIVKVAGEPSARWGTIALQSARVELGERVNIIQHPGGDQKQLSFFHNLVVYVGEGRVQYLTDTLPGSSGSPVFNKNWELVALHHSGGWLLEPGTKDRFFRNEGIHVDRVVDVLRRYR